MHCGVLDSICTTERNQRANHSSFHFLMLCRQRNKDYLCHWSMIETLAYQAKGLPPMATNAFSTLDQYSEEGSMMLAAAIASETTLSAGVNNYNQSLNKTFQAGDKSAIMHKATVMYLQRNMLPRLSFGSQLLDTTTGRVFSVVACHKLSPYHQLVQLRLLFVSTPLPCIAID
jgi:hypothetical protein